MSTATRAVKKKTQEHELEVLDNVSNDAEELISFSEPYAILVTVTGAAPILFHRWSCEDVKEKSEANKNSKAKKTDNLEAYIYRNPEGLISIPTDYFRLSICGAAKFKQDPRSPRKSAYDLFKAGVVSLEELAPINGGVKDWDYIDQRRVTIQRSAITRRRPAFEKGWQATFHIGVVLPEYIDQSLIHEVMTMAGKVIGLADMRPTYGRFQVAKFEAQAGGFE